MARRVFLHVGLPKTGTTYLQTMVWANKAVLREQGVLLPGFGPRQHLWASCVVREEPAPRAPAPGRAPGLGTARRRRPGLDRHRADQPRVLRRRQRGPGAHRRSTDLDDAEVHVVVTAREIVGLVTARWQEWVKNGATGPIDSYPVRRRRRPRATSGAGAPTTSPTCSRRWGGTLPPERVHVLTLPRPRRAAGRRCGGASPGSLGIDPDSCDTTVSRPNESLGVVEVELLRRVNAAPRRGSRAADRQGRLDPWLPRPGEAGAPRRRAVLALGRAGRRAAGPRRRRARAEIKAARLRRGRRPATTCGRRWCCPQRRHPDVGHRGRAGRRGGGHDRRRCSSTYAASAAGSAPSGSRTPLVSGCVNGVRRGCCRAAVA